ncbi:NUMOD1 domain-containing DNA-binding protein [Parapedobacter tibetensis]|uniref:NUMOD1 domain-containing DNA-binding protein n=1 Tax=Parapedobacter tibetensis TaxID=2972951 RepID=UPI00214D62DF|nr:NUMOD1 domain-containing DNA-binding protein [Parapedobacter tibetensis]
MEIKRYPFQDLSTPLLHGEEWKDIPNAGGHYQISNKGRARRLAHNKKTKQGISVSLPALILCQQVQPSYNSYTKDYRFYLRFSVTINDKRIKINTARFVYYCFVAPFDLKNLNHIILYRDNDSLNVSPENLYLGDPKEKVKRMIDNNRSKDMRSKLSPEEREARQQAQKKRSQEKSNDNLISQYDLEGNLIRSYVDAGAASKAVKLSASHIGSAAKNRGRYTAGGYLWRRGKAPIIDISEIKEKLVGIQSKPQAKAQCIGQYDLQGKLIRTFPNARAASSHLGMLSDSSIRAATNGKQHTSQGFIWRRGDAPKITIKKSTSNKSSRFSPLSAEELKITQYDFDGIRIRTYAGVNAASRETGISRSSIQRALKKEYVTGSGYLWQHGEALRIDLRPFKQHPGFNSSALGRHLEAKRQKNLEKMAGRMGGEIRSTPSRSVISLLEEAEARGFEKGKIMVLDNLIHQFGFSNEEAARAAGVPVELVQGVREAVLQHQK